MAGSVWQKVAAENLVRHRGGTYYLNAKVGGKKIRRSLETADLRIAKIKRDNVLGPLRSVATASPGDVRTVGDALELVGKRMASNPKHRPATRDYYVELLRLLRLTLPLDRGGAAWRADDVRVWWQAFASSRSASQANNALSMVRAVSAVLREAGLRTDDPCAGLKRMRAKRSAVEKLPPRETLALIVAEIRAQKKAKSGHVADMVEFVAWSGMRIGQARALQWEHVLEDWIVMVGDVAGAKGADDRRLPISAGLRVVIDRMRHADAKGPVFQVKSPREALKGACVRLGIGHMRVHDLRHWFATHAIESGVDVPTVAKWLGHKDGGTLAMRVYGHMRDEHSQSSAKKLG